MGLMPDPCGNPGIRARRERSPRVHQGQSEKPLVHSDHAGAQADDADTYWCGIENPGANLGTQIKVTVGPSKSLLSTLRGPGAQDWKNEVPSPPLPEGRRERMVSESECEQDQGTDGWGGRGRDQGRASLPSPAAHRIPEVSLRPLQ